MNLTCPRCGVAALIARITIDDREAAPAVLGPGAFIVCAGCTEIFEFNGHELVPPTRPVPGIVQLAAAAAREAAAVRRMAMKARLN
jgi:hypothetical protein